ncbi:MAG TPA: hypothetical protein VFT53_02455 [Candidatus Saccharimonadales bacterium]|nr:hypothetical protein [Candidatus Saccharimonadales bacterium]
MKAYFTAAIARSPDQSEHYMGIINYMKHLGHGVASAHIPGPAQPAIDQADRRTLLDFQEKIEKWIHDCDFMVADVTYPSVSVGYEISHALRLSKPVLVFYDRNGPPSLLRFHENDNMVTERYEPKTFKESLEHFIRTIEGKTETKFIFLITPKIAEFLNNIALKEKIPRSVYLRKLIERDMPNHDFHNGI